MDSNTQAIIDAIQAANKNDEVKIVDDILSNVEKRNASYFDIIYIDLSIDRTTSPLKISGAGTFIMAVEATDDLAYLSIGIGQNESNDKRRIVLRDGKRLYMPFVEFYVYNNVQAGKYIKLLRGRELPSVKVGVEDDSGESANSDLSTALGNSSIITTAQITVDTTVGGTVIKAANSARRRITIKVPNDASVPVFIKGAAVTTANGHRLDPGDAITLNTFGAIYGIVSAGSVVVTYLEE